MTIHWKAVEQYVTVVLFVFQFYPVCVSFGLGTVRTEKVNGKYCMGSYCNALMRGQLQKIHDHRRRTTVRNSVLSKDEKD